MKRRTFLKFSMASLAAAAGSTAGVLGWQPRAYASTIYKTFYITEGFITQVTGEDVYFRGFSSSESRLDIPGDSMIVQEGDTVRITVVNTLGSSHSFVIDGMIDSGTIRGGETRSFEFTARNPGSYLYNDGRNAPYNRLVGLHGGFAVMPQANPDQLYEGSRTFKQQQFWVFNDIDPVWHNRVRYGYTPSTEYRPRYFTLNGLVGRPPGAPGAMDPDLDAMADPRTKLDGHLGDRTLIRCLNPGLVQHAVHTHGNHMEWLTSNRQPRAQVWEKDIVPLDGDGGSVDVIFPFDPPPDAWPEVTNQTLAQAESEGRHFAFPMHLHNEMTQTAGGGLYMFGALTDIYYHAD